MAKLRLIPSSGEPIEVTRDDTLIGRDPSCDLVLPDGSVSRRHARIQRREGGWAVVDQASANGTFLDSQRVADAGLRDGHELRVGAVALRVEIETDGPDLAATVAAAEPDIEATVVAEAPVSELEDVLDQTPPYVAPSEPHHTFPSSPPPPPPAGGFGPPPGVSSAVDAPAGPAPGGSMKKPLMWVAGGCCGCLLLMLIVAGVIGGFVYFASQEPAKAVRAQLAEIRAGQIDAAFQRLDEPYQKEMSQAGFEQFVASHPALRDNVDASFNQRSMTNDRAMLAGVLTSSSEERAAVRFELRHRSGGWKITSIEVDGQMAGRYSE
jgi:predicted component of type VI protein secretion system